MTNGEFIALLGTIGGACFFLWNKLDQIRKEMSNIREHYVTHEVCEKRRKQCFELITPKDKENDEEKG